MVMGSWIYKKYREWERRDLVDKIDKEFGAGTYSRLEQEKQNNGKTPSGQSDESA